MFPVPLAVRFRTETPESHDEYTYGIPNLYAKLVHQGKGT